MKHRHRGCTSRPQKVPWPAMYSDRLCRWHSDHAELENQQLRRQFQMYKGHRSYQQHCLAPVSGSLWLFLIPHNPQTIHSHRRIRKYCPESGNTSVDSGKRGFPELLHGTETVRIPSNRPSKQQPLQETTE